MTDIRIGSPWETSINPYTSHVAECRCHQCVFEGPEVEPDEELIAKGWLKTPDKPPVKLHRLPEWLAEDDLPDGWQLPRLLPAGAVTLLSADPKAGKTQLVLSQLTAAHMGKPVLGSLVAQGISVALLTEEKRPSIRRGLHRVGMDFDNLPFNWWVGSLWDKDAAPDWQNIAAHLQGLWAENGPPDVLIVDTIGRWAACDDWNSYSRVIEATAPLHRVSNAFPRMGVMAIHHNKKGGGDIIAAASGSNALTGAVDHIVSMTKVGSDEGDENTRKLKFLSRFDVEDDTLLVRWEPSSGEYSIVTAGVGLKNLILEVLADAGEPMKAAAVLAQLPMQDDGSAYDVGAVRARLADAAKAGQIAIAGKAGNANLYQINDRTPLVQ